MIGYVKLFSFLASTQWRMALYFKLYFIYSMLLQCFADIGKSFAIVYMLLLIQCTILITLVGHVSFINVSIQLSVKSTRFWYPIYLIVTCSTVRTCMNVLYTSMWYHHRWNFEVVDGVELPAKCRCVTEIISN